MFRILMWIINYIIIGNNIWDKFIGTVKFEDALEMLKKGYFIYPNMQSHKLYGMIGAGIYEFNFNKNTVIRIDGFNKEAMLIEDWEILPSLEQAYFRGNK